VGENGQGTILTVGSESGTAIAAVLDLVRALALAGALLGRGTKETALTGKKNLPAGAPRRASQRRALHAARAATAVQPAIVPGQVVTWRGMRGTVLEACGDGLHVVIEADGQRWRAPIADCAPLARSV
jgi:hypothetical protein